MIKYREVHTDYELNEVVYYYESGSIYICYITAVNIRVTSDGIEISYNITAFSDKSFSATVTKEQICRGLGDIIKTIQVK